MNLLTLTAYPLLSKKPHKQSVATATKSFSLPGRAQLFTTACRLTSPTQTVSFRSPSYHFPRLFTGFSETVGIVSPLIRNVLSTTSSYRYAP